MTGEAKRAALRFRLGRSPPGPARREKAEREPRAVAVGLIGDGMSTAEIAARGARGTGARRNSLENLDSGAGSGPSAPARGGP